MLAAAANSALTASLLAGFTEDDDIGIGVAANDSQFLAIRRPMKIPNLLGREMRDLASRPAGKRLFPEVVHSVHTDGIHNRSSIRAESQGVGSQTRINLQHAQHFAGARVLHVRLQVLA